MLFLHIVTVITAENSMKKGNILIVSNYITKDCGEARILRENEQKAAAKAFATKRKGVGDEKQHMQTFWLELLHEVYGVD